MKPPFSLEEFVRAVHGDRFHWRRHVLERLLERRIEPDVVLRVLTEGECIESYPDDKPHPSALFFGRERKRPLHVVAAFDSEHKETYIVTAYEPDAERFEADRRTRKKR